LCGGDDDEAASVEAGHGEDGVSSRVLFRSGVSASMPLRI
jgi:hypothetical protein